MYAAVEPSSESGILSDVSVDFYRSMTLITSLVVVHCKSCRITNHSKLTTLPELINRFHTTWLCNQYFNKWRPIRQLPDEICRQKIGIHATFSRESFSIRPFCSTLSKHRPCILGSDCRLTHPPRINTSINTSGGSKGWATGPWPSPIIIGRFFNVRF